VLFLIGWLLIGAADAARSIAFAALVVLGMRLATSREVNALTIIGAVAWILGVGALWLSWGAVSAIVLIVGVLIYAVFVQGRQRSSAKGRDPMKRS
jgi:hypothetical protein